MLGARGRRTDVQARGEGGELPGTSPQGERAAGSAGRRRVRWMRNLRGVRAPGVDLSAPECGSGPGGRGGAQARAARRARPRPLVLGPYLGATASFVAPSRFPTLSCNFDLPTPMRVHLNTPDTGGRRSVSRNFLSALIPPREWDAFNGYVGGLGECGGLEKDAIRAGAIEHLPTCRILKSPHESTVNTFPPELPQLLTVSQFAQRLSICRRTVERLVASQKIRACKIGRSTRISVSELVRYIESLHGNSDRSGGAA